MIIPPPGLLPASPSTDRLIPTQSDISEYTELEFNNATSSRYSYDLYDSSDSELDFDDRYASALPTSVPTSPQEPASPTTGEVIRKRRSLPMLVVVTKVFFNTHVTGDTYPQQ